MSKATPRLVNSIRFINIVFLVLHLFRDTKKNESMDESTIIWRTDHVANLEL